MSYSKSVTVLLVSVVCLGLAADADAQSRGGRSGSGGPAVGRAAPRSSGGARTGTVYRGGSYGRSYNNGGRYYGNNNGGRYYGNGGRYYGSHGAPLHSYYYPYYGYGYGYGYRPGFSIGFSFGYPYAYGYPYYGYRYGYPYYGYPYGAYGYSYGGYYPAGYGYVGGGSAYGSIRIQGAVRNAEVYVDGSYAGIVDDFDGSFQRLDLEAGAHSIEV